MLQGTANAPAKKEQQTLDLTPHPYDRTLDPLRITFEELDFNFGERWIPTGIYSAYMSHLYETDVHIAYTPSMDEFSAVCDRNNIKIWDEFCVKEYLPW